MKSPQKHTLEDLQALQALPFERKILISQTRIMEWYHQNYGRVYVSYSGGKDSSVLLALVRKQFPEVRAVFVNTGLEYPEIVEHVRRTENVTILRPAVSFRKIIAEKGYPVVSKDVANTVMNYRKGARWAIDRMNGENKDGSRSEFRQRYIKWRFLADAPFKISDDCCEVMKETPLIRYQKAGEVVPFVGTLACESRRRTEAWLNSGCNAFESEHPRSTPLAFWTENDILRYIDEYKVPVATVYGEIIKTERKDGTVKYSTSMLKRTGCMFCLFGCHLEKQPNRIQRMAETHPKFHEYCLRDFDKGGLGLRTVMEYVGIPYEPCECKRGEIEDDG
jgi:3'-phosphoadenosine 5'-phosphosulfate sulfotransferase (PAPS reductase)/FAD synthetase